MKESEYVRTYVSIPREMAERAESAEGYNNKSSYIRTMASAGESNIAALDPRTQNGSDSENNNGDHDSLDKLIIEALDGDYAELDEILNNGIQQHISERLLELAKQDKSPIKKNGFRFKIDE